MRIFIINLSESVYNDNELGCKIVKLTLCMIMPEICKNNLPSQACNVKHIYQQAFFGCVGADNAIDLRWQGSNNFFDPPKNFFFKTI